MVHKNDINGTGVPSIVYILFSLLTHEGLVPNGDLNGGDFLEVQGSEGPG